MTDLTAPIWVGDALLAPCLKCQAPQSRTRPGAKYPDGSGVCEACGGSGWHVLTEAADSFAVDSFAVNPGDVIVVRVSQIPVDDDGEPILAPYVDPLKQRFPDCPIVVFEGDVQVAVLKGGLVRREAVPEDLPFP